MGFKLQMVEKLNNNSEEGYKIQIARCLSFKKTDVKVEKEETLTHKVTQQEKHRGKNPEKSNSGRLFGQKRVGALLQRERSVIALCVRHLGSVGTLLTQGQGRQVQKLLKVSKNPKIAVQSRQLG
jgi:hypothetical protein